MVDAGGEVAAIDSAGFGPITITQPVTITSPNGVEAGIAIPSGGTGITINLSEFEGVNLQGLTIDGGTVGTTGIQFNSGASLVVENCVIRNMSNDGINVYNSVGMVQLLISNSLVANNGFYGIFVFPKGTAGATATFNRVEVSSNTQGNIVLEADKTSGIVSGTAVDSISLGSDGAGYEVYGPATLNVFRSVASYNGAGLDAELGGTIRLQQSMVTGSNFGWLAQTGGSVLSYGNNSIDGNVGNQSPPPTLSLK